MSARGYTTKALVAQELGRTFSGAQDTQCDGLIEEAEAFIDNETGRAWLVTSPVTDEVHVLTGPFVYLDNAPVSAITSVKIRSTAIGASETTLVANSSYELIDAARGLINLSSYPLADPVTGDPAYDPGALVKVSYTFTSPLALPKDVQRAATLLVAGWMLPRLDPAMANTQSVSVGQGDVSVTYRASAVKDYEDRAQRLLSNYRRLVFA